MLFSFSTRRATTKATRLDELQERVDLLETKMDRLTELIGVAFIGIEKDWVEKAVYYDRDKKPDRVG